MKTVASSRLPLLPDVHQLNALRRIGKAFDGEGYAFYTFELDLKTECGVDLRQDLLGNSVALNTGHLGKLSPQSGCVGGTILRWDWPGIASTARCIPLGLTNPLKNEVFSVVPLGGHASGLNGHRRRPTPVDAWSGVAAPAPTAPLG